MSDSPTWKYERREPQGFTRTPEVRAILDRYECRDESGGIVDFEGLTVDDAIRLLERLPGWQELERQNESPTFGEMVRLGMKYPGTLFFGYRVVPEREDERIQLEGFLLPKEFAHHWFVEEIEERLKPDESCSWGDHWRFWWD